MKVKWIAALVLSLLISVTVGGASAAIKGEVVDVEDRSPVSSYVYLFNETGGFVAFHSGSFFVFDGLGAGQYWVFAQEAFSWDEESHTGIWKEVKYDGVQATLQLRLERGVSITFSSFPDSIQASGEKVMWSAVLINHSNRRHSLDVRAILQGPSLSSFFSILETAKEELTIEKGGAVVVHGSFRIPGGVPDGFYQCLVLEVFEKGKLKVLGTETRCARKGTGTDGGGGGGGGGKG